MAALPATESGFLDIAGLAPSVIVKNAVVFAFLKRCATLGTEEMTRVPMMAERKDSTALNWRLAVVTTSRKEFMVVKVTVEALSLGNKVKL